MLFEQIPQVLQIFFLQDFTGLVLKESCAGLLANFEVETALIGGLLEEKARDGLERWIARLLEILLLLEQLEELDIGFSVVLSGRLVRFALVEALELLDPRLRHERLVVGRVRRLLRLAGCGAFRLR